MLCAVGSFSLFSGVYSVIIDYCALRVVGVFSSTLIHFIPDFFLDLKMLIVLQKLY